VRRAIFLDRDGTLIKDNGFLKHSSKVSLYTFTVEALRILQKEFDLFIVTNQCGIANNILTLDEVEQVNKFIIDTLAADGIDIKDCYICPHAIDADCECRKPRPFFAEQAALRYGLDLSQSYMIGDHLSDMEFGKAFGGHGVYVLTGHGLHDYHLVPDNGIVATNLLFAAKKIMAKIIIEN